MLSGANRGRFGGALVNPTVGEKNMSVISGLSRFILSLILIFLITPFGNSKAGISNNSQGSSNGYIAIGIYSNSGDFEYLVTFPSTQISSDFQIDKLHVNELKKSERGYAGSNKFHKTYYKIRNYPDARSSEYQALGFSIEKLKSILITTKVQLI